MINREIRTAKGLVSKFKSDAFYSKLSKIVLPIILQNIFSAAVSSADVIMLNFVNQTALSAVSLAGQISFLANLFIFGLNSGIALMAAQYWGKRDVDSIEKILAIGMRYAGGISLLFAMGAAFVPHMLMRIYTNDAELIAVGSSYLRIVSIAFLLQGISQVFLSVMRSMERAGKSTLISSAALCLNILLNAVFIFGLFGAPKLGVVGVAIATSISRIVEFIWCLIDSGQNGHAAIRLKYLLEKNKILRKDFIHYAIPALGNELIWGVAFSLYSAIMGHLGSDAVAANSVVAVVRNLATVLCYGISYGGSILIGNELGSNNLEDAKKDGKRIVYLAIVSGAIGGLLILLIRPFVLSVVHISDIAEGYLGTMMLISSYYTIGQAINATVIGGIFRSGGDTRFGMICDFIDMWLFSVPLGLLCAFVLKLPVEWVYFALCLDEFVKLPFVYVHYRKYKWIKNITREKGL